MQENKEILPLIPLRGMTVFPNMVIYFDVGRKKSIAAIEKAMSQNQRIFLSAQKDINIEEPNREDIFNIGTICEIKQIVKLPKNSIRVLVEGIERGRIDEYYDKEDTLEVSIEKCELIANNCDEEDYELEAALRMLKDEFFEFLELTTKNKMPDFFDNIDEITDANKVADIIAAYVVLKQDQRQELLHLLNVKERIKKLLIYIKQEKELVSIEKKIDSMVKSKIDKGQKEYYLREQLKVIQEQLGEDDENKKAIKNYEEIIATKEFPDYVKEKAIYEISRLKTNSIHSQEGTTIRSYLDLLFSLPWNEKTEDNIDLKKAKKTLENAHYGLEDVKERIIEYLAVKKMSNSLRGPILCLVGPP
ncbi:MAG: LON peptidase substrate-binding domain-containing protein, partial [Sarcina sp.]